MSLGFDLSDIGRILENIVYLELIRRGHKITIGKWNSKEIDFVTNMPDGNRQYIQVCYDINSEGTMERELSPLREVKDSFKKLVIAMMPPGSYFTNDGIEIKNILEWLLE